MTDEGDGRPSEAGEDAPERRLPPGLWVPGLLAVVLVLLAVFGLG